MSNEASGSCCLCGESLKVKQVGHRFTCSHFLCSDCLAGYGKHQLRRVCFTCSTPETDCPKPVLCPEPGLIQMPKHPSYLESDQATDWKESTKRDEAIITRMYFDRDVTEKVSSRDNTDDVIMTQVQRQESRVRKSKASTKLERLLNSLEEKRKELDETEALLEKNLEEARRTVTKHAQMCRSLIDRDEKLLLQQLDDATQKTMRDGSSMRDGITRLIERTENLLAKREQTEAEVEQLVSARVNTVQFQTVEPPTLKNIRPLDESNTLAELVFRDIEDDASFLSSPILIGSIPGNSYPITGVTLLDRKIFVAADYSPELFVYQLDTLTTHRPLPLLYLLESLQVPTVLDLAACSRNHCLYVLDSTNSNIYRLRPDNGHLISWWKVKNPRNLSVTASGSVLVTSEKKIQEYDPGGKILRTTSSSILLIGIKDRPLIRHPRHVVESGGGNLIVSDFLDEGSPHVVYETDRKGTLLSWHGNGPVSGADGFNEPRHLAVAVSGHVLVVDRRNDRVVLMNRKLDFVRDLVTSVSTGVEVMSPLRLCLDLARGHLYVGQSNGLIMIFKVML